MKKVITTLLSIAWAFQLSMAQGNDDNDQSIYAFQKGQNMLLNNNFIQGTGNDFNIQSVYAYQKGNNNLIQENNEIFGEEGGNNNDANQQKLYSWIKGE